MRRALIAVTAAALVAAAAAFVVVRRDAGDSSVGHFVGWLRAAGPDQPAGPFLVGHVPTGHVINAVARGTVDPRGSTPWCAGRVCASPAFNAWRALGDGGYPVSADDAWPIGSYAISLNAPAPRVDDDRRYLLPTGTAIDVAVLPGTRADLTLAASYNAMDHEDEHGPSRDVWFDRSIVHVGEQPALLTEGYGTDEGFPRDVKTLYFEGPHGELGIVRATSNIFFGSEIWDRTEDGAAARIRRAKRESARQQISNDEIIHVAAGVRAATSAAFAAAARRVDEGGVCPAATGNITCRLPDDWCAPVVRACLAGDAAWGDWQRSSDHAVYMSFTKNDGQWYALAPAVRSVRITTVLIGGKTHDAGTVAARADARGVRWAHVRIRERAAIAHDAIGTKVTALDGNGRPLETVRTDLAGP